MSENSKGKITDKPKVGDEVFVCWSSTGSGAVKTKVKRVGRKYFEVEADGWRPLEFSMETNTAGYWGSCRGYRNRICFRDDATLQAKLHADNLQNEKVRLADDLGKSFDWSNRRKFKLDQLRRIKAIVDETEQIAGKK